jgi:hypothetical protein
MSGPNNQDVAAMLYNKLRYDTSAPMIAIRALLASGANSVFEAGDMTREVLNVMEQSRNASSAPAMNLALCLSVQDDGEEVLDAQHRQQRAIIRIYDRMRGYRNIRGVREAVIAAFDQTQGTMYQTDLARAHLQTLFMGRSGHRRDADMVVDFDALTFAAIVEFELDY